MLIKTIVLSMTKTAQYAGLAESADAADLKSAVLETYQFKSGIPHQRGNMIVNDL